MKINYVGRKIEIGDRLKEKVEKRLSKLDKFFSQEDAKINVVLEEIKNGNKAEIMINYKDTIFRAEVQNGDLMACVDEAVDILIRQIRKQKTKLENRFRTGGIDFSALDFENDIEESEFEVMKVKKFSVKPMDTEEAILQMNLLGHQFFVFRNVDENEEINVVYKRKDGKYGLISPSDI